MVLRREFILMVMMVMMVMMAQCRRDLFIMEEIMLG
jgi:hypothetical protein